MTTVWGSSSATASAAADQSTGEVDPEFLAGMERGEARGDK